MKKQLPICLSQQLPGIGRRGLLLLGLAGLAPAAAVAQTNFGAPTLYASGGTSPLGLALGDVNGDGRPDIVTAQQGTDNVGVLLAQAAPVGSFQQAITYSTGTGTRPTGVMLGDMNGDGRLDIVTGNQANNTVSLLLGSATAPGTFATAISYTTGGINPNILALGDLNSDGQLDVAVANTSSNTVGVLLNLATAPGTFLAAATYASGGTSPVGVTIGDVNADGRADIVVGNQGGTVGILLAAGAAGAFVPSSYASGGIGTVGVTLGDVNGDGRTDILATNTTSATISLLLGGAGGFAPPITYPSGGKLPNFTVLADVNGDGRPDLVTSNQDSGTIGVLTALASAPGTFAQPVTYTTGGNGPISLALGDVNADGRRDIVVANYNSNTVAILLNTYVPLASAAAQAAADVALYPNPAQGAFTVLLPAGTGTGQVELLNPLGQVVRRQPATLASGGTRLAVETAGLAPGMYTVRLQAGATTLARRVMLQ